MSFLNITFSSQIGPEKVMQEEVPSSLKVSAPKAPASCGSSRSKKQAVKDIYNERNNKPEVPDCDCFSSDKKPPEPGSYYTHLGKRNE